MSLEGLLGQMVGMPVAYGNMYTNMYNSMYNPMYSYGQSQAGNMAQLGGQSMGLYGNLAGQQASMYQAELPMQMEQAKWNSLAPALSGLLNQIGFGGVNLSPLSMQFNRPDVMAGYGSAVGNAYQNARGYDGWMQQNFAGHQGAMQDAMPPNPFSGRGGGGVGGGGGRGGYANVPIPSSGPTNVNRGAPGSPGPGKKWG